VRRTSNEAQKRAQLIGLLREIDGPGIIYASTVRVVEELDALLRGLGFLVATHHGRLGPRARKESQERFMAGTPHAMVATNAFGLGIDRPDIRFVDPLHQARLARSLLRGIGARRRDGRAGTLCSARPAGGSAHAGLLPRGSISPRR
jgi:ATP-dependent DNA helicase RecQ